ncbi:MAG: hypothetical protein ABSG63_20020, partial [Spirochaetia bacterium]
VFFVFIVGLTGYRIENARRQNTAAVHEQMSRLAAQAVSLKDTTGGYDAPQFKKDMRDLFDGGQRLLLISIHTPENGILYLVTRSRSYLKEPAALDPSWRGKPAYQVSRGYEVQLSQPLSEGGPTMDALFVVMGREDFYPVVRDDLFLFLAFLLVCGVIVLIVTNVQQDDAPRAARRRPAPPSSSPEPAGRSAQAASPEQLGPSRALTSPRTGLVWADHLEPRLRAELSRAAAADLDIALAKVRIDEPYADAKLPLVHAHIAGMLKESFSLHDLIFETGSDAYTLVLPDGDVDAAVRSLEAFRKIVAAAMIEGRQRSLSIGVSSRGGRLIEATTLMEEADVSQAKAMREGGNQVIGFRADPSRFRDTLTGSRA